MYFYAFNIPKKRKRNRRLLNRKKFFKDVAIVT